MSNYARIVCPQCGEHLEVPSTTTPSARVRCFNCQAVFPEASAAAAAASSTKRSAAVAFGVSVLVAIGLIMSMQPVSLMSGSGTIWVGVALAGVGVALAFFLGAPAWVRIVAPIILVLALGNVLYVEHQMSVKREEIARTLGR